MKRFVWGSDKNFNLLGHAQMVEADLGSECGGHGVCGKDRVLVKAEPGQLSPLTEAELHHLTKAEIAQGVRLACQCFPQKDGLELSVERAR